MLYNTIRSLLSDCTQKYWHIDAVHIDLHILWCVFTRLGFLLVIFCQAIALIKLITGRFPFFVIYDTV